MVDYLFDLFGPYDLNPAPDAGFIGEDEEWRSTWNEEYAVPAELLDSAASFETLRKARRADPHVSQETAALPESLVSREAFDSDKKERITKTLAFLHSRGQCTALFFTRFSLIRIIGVDALINFVIQGDAGGDDSQIQSLWIYQAFGGLPSKEYYEEPPILDLYQTVVQGILLDIATHTKASATPEKRDLVTDLEELIEAEGWPWPWPGDDEKGGEGKKPGDGHTKEEPIEIRMEKLAGKVVAFERELIRAGADPEYLFNPHYAYNPYTVETVSDALPFLNIGTYLATYSPRAFPSNITVSHPPYLNSVTKLVESTPDYVLSGYFATRLAMSYATALGPEVGIWKEARRLKETLQGIKKGTEENRQEVCLNWVDNIVGFIAGREFVRERFSPEAKAEGEGIIRCLSFRLHGHIADTGLSDRSGILRQATPYILDGRNFRQGRSEKGAIHHTQSRLSS